MEGSQLEERLTVLLHGWFEVGVAVHDGHDMLGCHTVVGILQAQKGQ